jgi:hypothetical protein
VTTRSDPCEGCALALYPGAANVDPETKRVLDVALEMTRISLRLEDDFANGMIVKQLIESAKTGERNPDLLCEGVLKILRGICTATSTGDHPSRPDPPRARDGPGDLATTCWAAGHDRWTNAAACRLVRVH